MTEIQLSNIKYPTGDYKIQQKINPSLWKASNIADSFEKAQTSEEPQNTKRGKFNTFINKLIGYNTGCTDGKDDGKLSFKEKCGSFLRGCLNMATNLIDSFIEHPIITTAVMGGTIGLGAAAVGLGVISAPALAIIMGGIGFGIGTFNIVKGIHNASKAQNDAEAKLAIETAGEGTATAALSAFSIKKGISGLKNTKNNAVTADIEKDATKSLKEAAAKPEAEKLHTTNNNIKSTKTVAETYTDDGIFGYDTETEGTRDYIRERIMRQSGLSDKELQVVKLDSTNPADAQLPKESKYFSLGEAKINKKTNEYIHICENLRQAADNNGVRGKTPLAGKKGIKWRLNKIKESGIKTVIDLRAEGECSKSAHAALNETGINYVNFPVEDNQWNIKSLDKITEFINTINKGDYYVGCANGEARTDLAVAINYILNPEAKNVPEFYFGTYSASRVSVKDNIAQIIRLVEQNKDIVKDWGWSNYDEFYNSFSSRFAKVISSIK